MGSAGRSRGRNSASLELAYRQGRDIMRACSAPNAQTAAAPRTRTLSVAGLAAMRHGVNPLSVYSTPRSGAGRIARQANEGGLISSTSAPSLAASLPLKPSQWALFTRTRKGASGSKWQNMGCAITCGDGEPMLSGRLLTVLCLAVASCITETKTALTTGWRIFSSSRAQSTPAFTARRSANARLNLSPSLPERGTAPTNPQAVAA